MSTQIRLRLAAFANMASSTLRIAASLLFVVVAARRLGLEGFAALGIVLSLYQAIPLLTHVWHWWAQRQVGEDSGAGARSIAGTGLVLTLATAPLGVLIYAIVSWATMRLAGFPVEPALLAGPAVGMYMVARYLNGVIAVRRPELVGLISLAHEASKLAAALLLVVGAGMGLRGAVLSLDVAALVMMLSGLYVYMRLGLWCLCFDRRRAGYWIRMWRLPALLLLINLSQGLVRPLYTWLTGLVRPVAYLNLALSISTPVVRVGQAVVPGLYARALRQGAVGDLEETIRIYLFFLVYVASLVAAASVPLASMFNPMYVDGHLVLVVGVLYALAVGLATSYRTYILGATPLEGRGYARLSRLTILEFSTFILGLAVGAVASVGVDSPWRAAFIYMGAATVARLVPLLVYHYIVSGQGFRFPWRGLLEAGVGGIASWAFLVLVGVDGVIVRELIVDGPRLLVYVAASLVVYIVVVLLVSPWARGLASRAVGLVARRVAS